MGSHAFQLACIIVRTADLEKVIKTRYLPPWHNTILHFPRFFISKRVIDRFYRIWLLLQVCRFIVGFVVLDRLRCFGDTHYGVLKL